MSFRDEVSALGPAPRASMFVRAWSNKQVFVRMLKGEERDALDAETIKRNRKNKNKTSNRFRERLIIACVENDAGELLFKPSDEDWLCEQVEPALNQMFSIALKHNGFVEDEEESAGNS